MAVDFNDPLGTDFTCVSDVDANLTLVDGRRGLSESAARRLQTPLRFLFYDNDYGDDVSNLIGAIVQPSRIARRSELEVLKDERVQDADSEVTLIDIDTPNASDDDIGNMRIDIRLTDEDGPFDLTLVVADGEVTIANLEEFT